MKPIVAPESLSEEWQKLVNKYKMPSMDEKRDDEMTAKEFAKYLGISANSARNILNREVEKGTMQTRLLRRLNNKIYVYSPVIPLEGTATS